MTKICRDCLHVILDKQHPKYSMCRACVKSPTPKVLHHITGEVIQGDDGGPHFCEVARTWDHLCGKNALKWEPAPPPPPSVPWWESVVDFLKGLQ